MAENAKSLNYLKKLDNAAQHGDTSASKELNKLTSGLGLTNFLSLLDLRHTELQNNIKNASTEDVASGRYKEWQKEMWMYEDYFDIGANNAQGEIDGYSKTVEDNKGNNESNVYMIEQDQKSFDQDSPSKIYYRMGMYNALGLVNGFRDTIDYLTKPTTETIEGLNEASSTAFQAMVNSLDDDSIQPTITPILDDSSFGISTLNRSFEGLTPMMQATVDSFQDDTPNYNSRFEMLANAIYGTNSLVNSFMQMVADGDIITVNVNAEADPNNIYNYVIDANRRKFRQTGKNPLAY